MSEKSPFDLMKWKKDQWEELNNHRDKCIVVGRLEMLKDLTDYIESLRESYTRLLVINGIDEEEYDTLKKKKVNKEVHITIDSNTDDEGDTHTFDNC